MKNPQSSTAAIDAKNEEFTSGVKSVLKDLSKYDDAELDWLMMEHYQFSHRNAGFLSDAANRAGLFRDSAIQAELLRNYNEERDHYKMYKRALHQMGTDVDRRREFPPTTAFFERLVELIAARPSVMLGTLYATEAAAIFEHEVFRDISEEVAARRGHVWEGSELKAFHDLHLNGVEQSHKDELGVFIKPDDGVGVQSSPSGDPVDVESARKGGFEAIAAMRHWWDELLKEMPKLAKAKLGKTLSHDSIAVGQT